MPTVFCIYVSAEVEETAVIAVIVVIVVSKVAILLAPIADFFLDRVREVRINGDKPSLLVTDVREREELESEDAYREELDVEEAGVEGVLASEMYVVLMEA
jgi:hypothetical protein